MKKISFKKIFPFWIALIDIIILDRIIKYFATHFLTEDIIIIPGILKFALRENTGIAFSIGLPYFLQLIMVPVLVLIGLYAVYTYLDIKSRFVQIVSGIIIGGAITNFIDRILFQHVIDYISVSIYPVFNLADIGISLGIFLIVVFYGKIKRVSD